MANYKHIIVISVYDGAYEYSVAIDNGNYCRGEIENPDLIASKHDFIFNECRTIGLLVRKNWQDYQTKVVNYIRTHNSLNESLIIFCEDGVIDIFEPTKAKTKKGKQR